MKKYTLIILAMALGFALQAQESIELNNDTLHLKQDLIRGGSISYISVSGSDRNLVNIHDEGRYIQQSYYAGRALNRQAEGQNPNWSPWGWNPIQAGDSYRNRAQILEQSSDGHTLYVKCIPMLWDMNNEPAEAEMEQWTTLMGNVVKVRNKITCMRTDDIWEEGTSNSQELPAVYPIASLKNLYSYFGSFPFTGAPLSNPEVVNLSSGFWGRYPNMAKESWMAFVDDNNWGMAVFTPITENFIAGRSGKAMGEAMDGSTSYISPIKNYQMYKNTVIEYEYYLVIGTLDQIRKEIYALKGVQANRWEFEDDLDGWSMDPEGGSISREEGMLKFSADGNMPSVGKNLTEWSPDTLNYLWINMKNETAGDSAALKAFNQEGDSLTYWFATTASDTGFSDYVIRLDTLAGWKSSGNFKQFKLIPTEEGEVGDVSVEFIRFTENLMELSSYGNYRELIGLGNTLQLYARSVPSLEDMDVSWSVDQPALASVDENGLLTAISEGWVAVTVTDKEDGSLSASLTIEIIDDEQKTSWEFDRDLGGWELNPNNAEVSHEGKVMVYTVTGGDPYVSNQVAPWPVNDLKYLWMSVKNETAGNGGSLYFFPEDGGHDRAAFPLTPNDTAYRDIFVDMRAAAKWNSKLVINSLRLDGNNGGEPGNIYVDFIRFRDELVRISSDSEDYVIDEIGKTLQLSANVIVDTDLDVDFEWITPDSAIVLVDQDGLVTAVSEGTAIIKVLDMNGSGISGEVQVSVELDHTALESRGAKSPVIFPNPVSDVLYVGHASNIEFVTLFNVSGQAVKEVSGNAKTLKIGIADLEKGAYLLRMRSTNGKYSYAKIVKK